MTEFDTLCALLEEYERTGYRNALSHYAPDYLRALLARVGALHAAVEEAQNLASKATNETAQVRAARDLLDEEVEPPAWFTPEVVAEAEANIAAGRVYTLREVELREALAAVTDDPPWDYNEHGDRICGWCGNTIYYNRHRDYPGEQATRPHAPDCAWLRACALLD